MLIVLYTFLIAFYNVGAVKVFLMGGAVANNQTDIYVNLAKATGKIPTPKQCSNDWGTTSCPKIAVITSAAADEAAGNQAYTLDQPDSLSYKTLFELYGFSPKHISVHIDNYIKTTNLSTAEGQANLQILKQADIIFFNGGDQSRHARAWLNNDGSPNNLMQIVSKRANSNEAILSGTSAGSMIMCSPIYGDGIPYGHLYFSVSAGLAPKNVSDGAVNGTGTEDMRNGSKGIQHSDNGGIMPGFGFLPFLVDTHFDARGRLGRIIPAIVSMKKDYGVGVDESSAFFYDNGKAKVYGKNGAFIVDITKATLNIQTYFGINNVIVHYLTSGDEFDFSTKQLKPDSSKKLISQPNYPSFVDSSDIFSSYENTKLITHLVDQIPNYNIGRSRIPSGYPKSAPIFKMTFFKNNATLGYLNKEKNKYTAANVLIYITYE